MKPFRFENLTPSKVRRSAVSGGTVTDSSGETIYKDDAFEGRPFPSNDDLSAHGRELLQKYQDEAVSGLSKTPEMTQESIERHAYMAIASALPQFIAAKKITPEEIAWCLRNPLKGVKFLEDEARKRMPGTTLTEDLAFAGFSEYLSVEARRTASHREDFSQMDRAMLGSGKMVKHTRNANGTRAVEMVDVPTASGPWYRNAAGQLVMNNVRPSQAAAASARLEREIRRARGGR